MFLEDVDELLLDYTVSHRRGQQTSVLKSIHPDPCSWPLTDSNVRAVSCNSEAVFIDPSTAHALAK
jgi:hypothetical protein